MTYFIDLDKAPEKLPKDGKYSFLEDIHTKEEAKKWAEEHEVVVYWINSSCVLQERG